MKDSFFITIDCDWASAEMIIESAKLLIENNIKATWFVTDSNKGIDFLKGYPLLFDLGIHPNFMKNSTQGDSEEEIINSLFKIVSDCSIIRTHGLLQSSNMLESFSEKYNLKIDSSLFMPFCENIEPHFFHFSKSSLFRIPYNWGDNYALNNFNKLKSNFDLIHFNGLKVFNFHPIHIYHNISSIESYNTIKNNEKLVNQISHSNEFGIKDYLLELIFRCGKNKLKSEKLIKIYNEYEC